MNPDFYKTDTHTTWKLRHDSFDSTITFRLVKGKVQIEEHSPGKDSSRMYTKSQARAIWKDFVRNGFTLCNRVSSRKKYDPTSPYSSEDHYGMKEYLKDYENASKAYASKAYKVAEKQSYKKSGLYDYGKEDV